MKITEFPHYIFWSYQKDADLPDEVIARQVFLYGDVRDMIKTAGLIQKDHLIKALDKIKTENRHQKRTHFIEKVILI